MIAATCAHFEGICCCVQFKRNKYINFEWCQLKFGLWGETLKKSDFFDRFE